MFCSIATFIINSFVFMFVSQWPKMRRLDHSFENERNRMKEIKAVIQREIDRERDGEREREIERESDRETENF